MKIPLAASYPVDDGFESLKMQKVHDVLQGEVGSARDVFSLRPTSREVTV